MLYHVYNCGSTEKKVVFVSLQFKMSSTADAEHISIISMSNRCSVITSNIYIVIYLSNLIVAQMPSRYGLILKNLLSVFLWF